MTISHAYIVPLGRSDCRLHASRPGETDSISSSDSQTFQSNIAKVAPVAATLGVLLVAGAAGAAEAAGVDAAKRGVFLADLPYDYKALEPYIGEKTLRIHHGKHHAKYVATTNALVKGTEMENDDVVSVLRKANGKNQALFNNAAQCYNHAFYWENMKPKGGGQPSGSTHRYLFLTHTHLRVLGKRLTVSI